MTWSTTVTVRAALIVMRLDRSTMRQPMRGWKDTVRYDLDEKTNARLSSHAARGPARTIGREQNVH